MAREAADRLSVRYCALFYLFFPIPAAKPLAAPVNSLKRTSNGSTVRLDVTCQQAGQTASMSARAAYN